MSVVENKETVETKIEFQFEETKISEPTKDGSVTISMTKDSSYLSQAKNPEESKRVLEEIGEYQKQALNWSNKRAKEVMKKDDKIQKVKVKSPNASKDERLLSVSVVAVRERQLGPENKGAYIASAISSTAFADKNYMKKLREDLANGLK